MAGRAFDTGTRAVGLTNEGLTLAGITAVAQGSFSPGSFTISGWQPLEPGGSVGFFMNNAPDATTSPDRDGVSDAIVHDAATVRPRVTATAAAMRSCMTLPPVA